MGEEEPCGRTSDEEGDEDAEENPLEQLCNDSDSYVIYSEKEIDFTDEAAVEALRAAGEAAIKEG